MEEGFIVKINGEDYYLKASRYTNGVLAVFFNKTNDNSFNSDTIIATVNLGFTSNIGCSYIDINNHPEIIKILEENDIAKQTNMIRRSGFVEYPLYLFNEEILMKASPEQTKEYKEKFFCFY